MNFHEYAIKQGALDQETKALAAIRAGVNLRNPNHGDFWNDFMRICNQPDTLAALLNIPKDKITQWPSAIRRHLELANKLDAGEAVSKRATMITTGY